MLIAKENVSPLGGILGPGMRAFTIEVSMDSALAGLVVPGDVVDVILTHTVSKAGEVNKEYVSKTILYGLSVLAVDQEMTIVSADSKSAKKPQTNKKNVTLEVTPQQAEILALSKSMGILSLSLSSPANNRKPTKTESISSQKDEEKFDMILFHGEKFEQIGTGGS